MNIMSFINLNLLGNYNRPENVKLWSVGTNFFLFQKKLFFIFIYPLIMIYSKLNLIKGEIDINISNKV
jgi:hypothetical protein